MLNSFIEDIIWEIPKLTEKKVYRIFCSLKARNNKYSTFWFGKRDGARFGVSCRQMTYFINLMIDYWFLKMNWEAYTKWGHKCRVFKASKQLKEYFIDIKDYVFSGIKNLTEWIRNWNNSQDIASYLSTTVIIRKDRFNYEWVKYIIGKRKHEWKIYNTETWRGLTLFDFLLEIYNENILNLAFKLRIVWS